MYREKHLVEFWNAVCLSLLTSRLLLNSVIMLLNQLEPNDKVVKAERISLGYLHSRLTLIYQQLEDLGWFVSFGSSALSPTVIG